MSRKRHIVIAFGVVFVLLGSLFYYSMAQAYNPESAEEYDPWVDVNGDGTVDIFDLVLVAGSYGASGDATRSVNVMNWPVSSDTTVWYQESLVANEWLYSPIYNVSGFGHLHFLMEATDLSGTENVHVFVYGLIWDLAHTSWTRIRVYALTLSVALGMWTSITIPVPSETFKIEVLAGPTTYASFSLSFYVTWA